MSDYRIKKPSSYRLRILIGGFIIVIAGGVTLYLFRFSPAHQKQSVKTSAATANVPQPKQVIPPPPPPKPKIMGTFSGAEFKAVYDQNIYPNTKKITSPLPITGDEAADTHIRALAVSRGYQLRSIATAPLETVDNFTLQPHATEAWRAMKAAALVDSLDLRLVAGFREFADQRALFLNALANAGVDASAIAGGSADAQISTILQTVSIPGYSKHHTGYTVDIGCGAYGSFVNSPCFGWLSADNYANAKKFGWIPSYPPDTYSQGPQPEPWEYVWVGTEALMREAP